MNSSKPTIALTMGDPSGIGPEILVKAMADPQIGTICHPWVIGDETVLGQIIRTLKSPLQLKSYPSVQKGPRPSGEIPLLAVPATVEKKVLESLKLAAALAMNKTIDAIVTAPIHKESLKASGTAYPGHTEFFAAVAGTKAVGMMMVGGPLKIMLTTTHAAIRDLPGLVTQERVETAIRLAHRSLQDDFNLKAPRLAVAALNPHGGEREMFGSEERETILPVVQRLVAEGMGIHGPMPADTVFRKAAAGEYDAVVAMYHDQALIPIKLIAFGRAVNITVGLPFIRTSVDHGTADDIAGKGLADEGSLLAAIRLAVHLVKNKRSRQR